MKNPNQFYEAQYAKFTHEERVLKKQLFTLSIFRTVVFIATIIAIYFSFKNVILAIFIAVFGVTVFLLLLVKYTRLKYKRMLTLALLDINKDELFIASGTYSHKPTGEEFQEANHPYALDIDLFGEASFYQYLNRTETSQGAFLLANLLKENNPNKINLKQEAVKELATKPEWRQHFAAIASLLKIETPIEDVVTWVKNYKPQFPKWSLYATYIFSVASIGVIILAALRVINLDILTYWIGLGLLVSGLFFKRVTNIGVFTGKYQPIFEQYSRLLKQIETELFSSEMLKNEQKKIQDEQLKASALFKKFSRYLSALDNRNNLIGAIFGNGFFLNDLKNSYKIERWLITHRETVLKWFQVVAFFDAYNSLGNYAFNKPNEAFPELIQDKNTTIKATCLGHPLLKEDTRITSDFKIGKTEFFIVTGANMAGKSTFLRTVSLGIVMANVGLPVCAKTFYYNPVKLITSMRTNDSLAKGSSYFFAELSRLKFIVNQLKETSYFVILDEILKGTNSVDKAKGSKQFVEKLIALKATGIIATHDLSLCTIAEEFNEVKNYFFDAQITNNELYFDYVLKKGVCQNMNASFLLKKMEIV